MNHTEMSINIDEEMLKKRPPTKYHTARQIPHGWKQEADRLIQDLLDAHIIEEHHKDTPFLSPTFFVQKPHKKALRFVTDFWEVNRYIKREPRHFPSVQDIQKRIPASAKYFISCDLLSAYHQIKIKVEDRYATAFMTEHGIFKYNR